MKTLPAEILSISAIELSRRLHSREVTAVELMKATLTRIDDVNPKVRAIVALRKDRAKLLQEAQDADSNLDLAASTSGAGGNKPGWLSGIPLCIKDLEDAQGFPTTLGGCPLFGEYLSEDRQSIEQGGDSYTFDSGWRFQNEEEDATYVRRLKDAGAIIIGKTNAPELGMGCHSYNTIHGTTLNPYNRTVTAGGSSGGAGAALASNMVCISDGSDMMGSLRNPAGWNNLYSLRPTSEWMEDANEDTEEEGIQLPYPISSVGPMARCPEDLAMFLETILPEEKTGFAASVVLEQSAEELDALVKTSTIGWLNDWGGALPFEDGVLAHSGDVLKTFEERGANIKQFKEAPFSNDDLWDAWMTIRSHKIFNSLHERIGCGADDVLPTLRARGVKPEAIWECERGKSLTKEQLQYAVDKVRDWSLCTDELFKTHDFLALPSSQMFPFDASIEWPKSIAGVNMDTYHRWMNVMVPVTLLGVPCVTVPHQQSSSLPMGLTIFSKKGNDSKLLQLARWYHQNSIATCPDLAV